MRAKRGKFLVWDMKNVIKISHALDIYSYIVLVVIYEFYGDMTVK